MACVRNGEQVAALIYADRLQTHILQYTRIWETLRLRNTKFLYTQQNIKYEQGGNIKVSCTLRSSCCWTLEICDSVDINIISQGVILKTAPFPSNAKDSVIDRAPASPTAIIKSLGYRGAFDQLSKLLSEDNVLTIIHILWGGVSADPACYQLYLRRLHDSCFLN